MRLVVRGGRLLDGAGDHGVHDLYVKDGAVEGLDLGGAVDAEVDAEGRLVTPAFLDLHVHLRDPWVMGLVRRVAERGHEVGLHPSYGSFRDPAQVRRELERLLAAADELGVEQDEWGGRQHFLRWEAPTTWRAWADAGLAYDSSLGYADRVGFRSGTCHEHEVFDLRARRRLPLRERPLVVMEATLLERKYMGLGHEAAVETARRLRATCERFGGDFTLLWHNSYLLTAADRQAFRRVIA